MNRRNAIITLGPSTEDDAILYELCEVATAFRLNCAHLVPDALGGWLSRLQSCYGAIGRAIPLVLDLQGAKMRLGELPDQSALGEHVALVLAEQSQTPDQLPVPHPQLFAHVKAGEKLWVNDARVELVVRSINARRDRIEATVSCNGPVSSRKGINRPLHPIPLAEVATRDRAAIAQADQVDFVRYAFSFVHTGAEARLLRELTRRPLSAKIERLEAFEHLASIAAGFDDLWLCRGDLGAQAGVFALAQLQRRFAAALCDLGRPGYLAGQVLEHLSAHPLPTRAEVVQLLDAERAGFSGIVLSDETAVGSQLERVIRFLRDWQTSDATP